VSESRPEEYAVKDTRRRIGLTVRRTAGAMLAFATLLGVSAIAAPTAIGAPTRGTACAGTAYVANIGAGTVSVVDTKAGTVTDTITVGKGPYGVAFSPDGQRVYVTNHADNSVSVIDAKTHTVTATIPVGVDPWDVAVTPDAKHVYTANDGGPDPATVSDITTSSGQVSVIDGVAGASAVAARPGGAEAYTAGGLSIITVIDAKTGTLSQTPSGTPAPAPWTNGIKLGDFNTEAIRFSPDGTRAYATTNFNGSVVVVDTKTRSVLQTIKVGDGAVGLAVTPDGTKVYVVSDGGLVAVDPTTGVAAAPIAIGPMPEQVAITADGKRAYVSGGLGAASLSVVDLKAGAVTSTIPVGAIPMGVALCPAPVAKR
jgi:YVTN family beta-propeller protein